MSYISNHSFFIIGGKGLKISWPKIEHLSTVEVTNQQPKALLDHIKIYTSIGSSKLAIL